MTSVNASRLTSVLISFLVLLALFWVGLRHSSVAVELGPAFARAFVSFALLFAPLWFSGFGACALLEPLAGWKKVLAATLLALPYFVFALGTPVFAWRVAAAVIAFPALLAAFLEAARLPPRLVWRDLVALAIITVAYFLDWFHLAWPLAELALLPKLFLADIAVYCFFLIRGVAGSGNSLLPTWSALRVGMREWAFYVPFALILGEATGFLDFHPTLPSLGKVAAAILYTSLLIALPEELFFRAILQNLLETRLGRHGALAAASILFGLSHFNHGARFNSRYVLLAAIAGIFYGRAWRAHREIVAAICTHTAVDVVWSMWFR
jgi:membrane protease YdiL (CAAX protease family)